MLYKWFVFAGTLGLHKYRSRIKPQFIVSYDRYAVF